MTTGFKAQEADSLWKNYLPEFVPFETQLARITRFISKACQYSPLALTLIASYVKKTKYKSIEQQLLLAFVALQRNSSKSFSTSNYLYTSVIESIKVSVDALRRKCPKTSIIKRYNCLVLVDDSSVISPLLFMILCGDQSMELAQLDLQLFYTYSLITRRKSSTNLFKFGYKLHSLHVTYLRDSAASEIYQYRQEGLDGLRYYCHGQWFHLDNEDATLWKILFQCCKALCARGEDFPCGLLTDLRTWNAYARARGLMCLYDEMQECIRRSSSVQLKNQLREFFHFIQREARHFSSIQGSSGVPFEFLQTAVLFEQKTSNVYKHALDCIESTEDQDKSASFYWTHSVDNVARLDKDCVFSWNSFRPCVDYKHPVVFCARGDGTIDKLTRNQHTYYKMIMKRNQGIYFVAADDNEEFCGMFLFSWIQ